MRRKWVIFGLSLLIVIGSFPSFSAEFSQGDSTSVSRKGVILVDDEGDGDYTSIKEALNNSNPGDTIEIYSGIYYEYNITITFPINILGISQEVGEGNDTGKPVIKQPLLLNETYFLMHILYHNVTVRNCNFQGYDTSDRSGIGIYLKGSNYCRILNNDFKDVSIGIEIWNSHFFVIENNSIKNMKYDGIWLEPSSNNNIIRNNTISGVMKNGISINIYGNEEFYNCSIIQNNISHCFQNGIVAKGQGIIINENVISDCQNAGVSSASFDSLIHNHIYDCIKGITVVCNNNVIKENIVVDCDVGMEILCQGAHTMIEDNEIRENTIGMKIDEPDIDMVSITRNNFIQNKIQSIFTAIRLLSSSSIWSYNYWGEELKFPKPLFGFGVILSFHSDIFIGLPVPWVCFDRHPVQEPYDIQV